MRVFALAVTVKELIFIRSPRLAGPKAMRTITLPHVADQGHIAV
jgi:hypothetical protein